MQQHNTWASKTMPWLGLISRAPMASKTLSNRVSAIRCRCSTASCRWLSGSGFH